MQRKQCHCDPRDVVTSSADSARAMAGYTADYTAGYTAGYADGLADVGD
jgi:hypothetical protein